MTAKIFELPKKSGIRKLLDLFQRKRPRVCDVAVLDVDTGLKRDDDCYSCASCSCTHYAIHRDGSIGCWGCGEVMWARWFTPDDDPEETEEAEETA
jgi:hypothetical protein